MKIGIIGLGRMGRAIVQRLVAAQVNVIGYDPAAEQWSEGTFFTRVDTLSLLVREARVLWLMVPAGKLIDEILEQLVLYLQPGDIIVDGGNSYFKDSVRRAAMLTEKAVGFLDCGTSGGVHGADHGFSLMVGGDKDLFIKLEVIFKVLAAPQGYAYVGSSGAGHYVKMVHNGIEYALMQSYAEGFELLKKGSYAKELDLATISHVWSHGSVIRSWLLTLLHAILEKDQSLASISGKVDESGTGKWTVEEAHAHNVSVKLIEDALAIRNQSHHTGGTYATKLVALLRQQFGGHAVYHENN